VAKKLSALEKTMMELAYESRLTEIKLKQLAEGMEEFKAEMKAFKDEMKDFKDEMKAFKDEMKVFKDEMKAFKDEMKDFKDEMKDFKDEMNKKWGELARKMGTLIEDIFVPSIDLAIEKYFHVVVKDVMPRRKIRRDGRTFEVDILALAGDLAFVVEVKASPNRVEYVYDFVEKLAELPEFIPEIKSRRVVPIYAALDMAGNTVDLLTKNGIYAMVVRGDILEIVNFDMLRPVQ
jgi:predicted nuclease with TOPRIM domain